MSPEDLRVLAEQGHARRGSSRRRGWTEVHARIDTSPATASARCRGGHRRRGRPRPLCRDRGGPDDRVRPAAAPSPPSFPLPTTPGRRRRLVRGSGLRPGIHDPPGGPDDRRGGRGCGPSQRPPRAPSSSRASAHENCNQPGGCYAPLLFTDGSEILRIGRVARHVGSAATRSRSPSAGSTLVWFEPSPDSNAGGNYVERGQYIAYDTAARREVARFGSADADIKEVYDGSVYWTPDDHTRCLDYSKYYAACLRFSAITRLDTSTGTQTEVPWASYTADRDSRPSTFVLPIKGDPDTPGPVYDETPDFGRSGDRLVGDDGGNAVLMHLASTGEPVRLHLPTGYDEDVAAVLLPQVARRRPVLPGRRQHGRHPGLPAVQRAVPGRGEGAVGLRLRRSRVALPPRRGAP